LGQKQYPSALVRYLALVRAEVFQSSFVLYLYICFSIGQRFRAEDFQIPQHRKALSLVATLKLFVVKSFKKILLRLFKFGLILILTIYVGLFLYFQFGWTNHYPKQQVETLVTVVQNTQTLPDNFYLVYDKIYSDRHEKITTRYLKSFWPEFFMIKQPPKKNWQLITARMTEFKGYRYKIAPMTLAFKLNKQTTPEKCFDYVMTKLYSEYSAKFKMNDTITNLTDNNRIIDFIVASQRPHYYWVHPTTYKQQTDSLKILISTK
jgi:hypothetical protein